MAARLGIRCAFVPVPFAPMLAGVRALESMRVPFPIRSESLLGLQDDPDSAKTRTLAVQALARRITRAERWTTWAHAPS